MFETLHLVYGLGIFLYGMNRIERGLESFSQNHLQHWLTTYTRTPILSVITGVVITAMLQSSSLVTLLMMAFVSTNMVPFKNAIGVVLGANLGTTFTGWIVTTVGFKLPLSDFALPLMGIGSILFLVFLQQERQKAFGRFLIGLGLILLGLDVMKSTVSDLPELFDFTQLAGLPAIVFLLAGAVLTAIIQSSSATMMITLTLLHGGLIQLPEAAAFIIGADLGTTSTSALGALTGKAARKQMAMAHIVFNLIVDLFAFVVLLPVVPWLINLYPSIDRLYALVLFHSAFNLIGLSLFIPFIRPFSDWLNRLFVNDETELTRFIQHIPASQTPMAIDAMRSEVSLLLTNTLSFVIDNVKQCADTRSYEEFKQIEGELIQFETDLNSNKTSNLLTAGRQLVIASRTIISLENDWPLLEHPNLDTSLENWQEHYTRFVSSLQAMDLKTLSADDWSETASQLKEKQHLFEKEQIKAIYAFAAQPGSDEVNLSSLLNLNREMGSAMNHVLLAVAEILEG